MPEVVRGTLIFFYLAIVAGVSFFGTLTHRIWRYIGLGLLWTSLFATGYYYWPSSAYPFIGAGQRGLKYCRFTVFGP